MEFSLEEPKGGVHFVIPDGEGSLADRVSKKLLLDIKEPTFYLKCFTAAGDRYMVSFSEFLLGSHSILMLPDIRLV